MANVLEYLAWRGDLSLTSDPFNEIDNLILCCLSYLDFGTAAPWDQGGSLTLAEAARWFEELPGEPPLSRSPLDPALLRSAGGSRRFRDLRLTRHVDKFSESRELQFSATTFLLDEDTAYVAFRGTDNTLVGWKEDFNMTFLDQIPAQQEAAAYLSSLESLPQKRLLVGGHSKGGNLAVFAAAKAPLPVQDRIATVYTNDSPGFGREFLDSPQYGRIAGRIRAFVPQSSIIGRLLEHTARQQIVHSNETGLQQHDPYTWEVMGPGFVPEEEITAVSQVIDQSLKAWMEEMEPEERQEFVNMVYMAMRSTNAGTLREFSENRIRNWRQVLRVFHAAPEEDRKFMFSSLGKLLNSVSAAIGQQVRTRRVEKLADWENSLTEFFRRSDKDAAALEEADSDPETTSDDQNVPPDLP